MVASRKAWSSTDGRIDPMYSRGEDVPRAADGGVASSIATKGSRRVTWAHDSAERHEVLVDR